VEGVEQFQNDWYWWGGNLEGAEKSPVQLSVPNKLVYQAHDYGPSVAYQGWFSAPNFPQNLAAVWVKHWAYLEQSQNTPVMVGEFGGPSVGQDIGGIWQQTLVNFLKANNLSYTYWCWNPNSGDTGGILENDWTTINQAKLDLLKTYQWPLLDKPQA
jgi:endoglucanase